MTDEPAARRRIGEVAARTGVTPRTLRYYEELGLVAPASKSPGGSRRYSEDDITRIERVLELRNIMGFDLERIAAIVHAENRLADLREEYRRGSSAGRTVEITAEAIAVNNELRAHVAEKIAVLNAFARDLDERAVRLAQVAAEVDVPRP